MLVLSRKVGESIVIGDNITLIVQKIGGNRVALGVEAPTEVSIVRSELSGGTKPDRSSKNSEGHQCGANSPAAAGSTPLWHCVNFLENA